MAELVIDADSHAAENVDALARAFDDPRRDLAPHRVGIPGTPARLALAGRPLTARFAPPDPGGRLGREVFDPAARVDRLDAERIDAAVVFPTVGLLAPVYEDAAAAAAFCRAVNDWLIAFCAAAPARLAPVAILPQQDVDLAARELDRALAAGAVAGVVRPNEVAGRTPADAAFDPLWALAVDLDAAIVLHEGTFDVGIPTLGAARAASYAELHLMAHPFELQATLAGLALRGTLRRFPGLRLGAFEAGFGWAPYLADRLAAHAEAYGPDAAGAADLADLAERVWVTADPDEPLLAHAAGLGWGERVCFATDFPHADGLPAGAAGVARRRGGRGFAGGNALGLFGERLARRIGAGS